MDVEHARPGLTEIPIGLDLCDSSLGPQLLQARDSGQPTYAPDSLGGPAAFAVGTPLYRNGSHPSTLAARRANLIGFTGTEILPKTILTTALMGHPNDAVAFHYKRRRLERHVHGRAVDPKDAISAIDQSSQRVARAGLHGAGRRKHLRSE